MAMPYRGLPISRISTTAAVIANTSARLFETAAKLELIGLRIGRTSMDILIRMPSFAGWARLAGGTRVPQTPLVPL
jgi:hypothetical protein